MITIYSPEEVEKVAAAGKLTAETLSMLEKAVEPGMSTKDLDQLAEKFIRERGGIPACKGYQGFPATICTSVNEVVVHGIPCLLYTSPSPRDRQKSRMPSSA